MKLTFREWVNTLTPFQQENLGFFTMKAEYLSQCYDEYVKQLEKDHKESVKHADQLILENKQLVEKYERLARYDNNIIMNLERINFNLETHYEILKENYDLVFDWVAEMKGCSKEISFDAFKGWLLQGNNKSIKDVDF